MTELYKQKDFDKKYKNKKTKNNVRFATFWFGTLPVFLTPINVPASFVIASRPYMYIILHKCWSLRFGGDVSVRSVTHSKWQPFHFRGNPNNNVLLTLIIGIIEAVVSNYRPSNYMWTTMNVAFVAWINLEQAIPTCVYKETTQLIKTAFYLLFPLRWLPQTKFPNYQYKVLLPLSTYPTLNIH